MKKTKQEVKESILKHLRDEPGLTRDVLHQKVDPERATIYPIIQELKNEGALTYVEHERPSRFFLTTQVTKPTALAKFEATPFVQQGINAASTKERDSRASLNKLVAQKLLELALLYERLSKLDDDGHGFTCQLAA